MPDSKKEKKKNTEKKSKRNKWIIALSLFFIIGLSFVIFWTAKFKFVIDDELTIDVSPQNLSYFIYNNEPVEINFTISTSNFIQCGSQCDFSLVNLANGSVVYKSQENLDHNEKVYKSFVINPPGKGSGQMLYSFETDCRNVNTIICYTDGKPRHETHLITINYGLSEKENTIKLNTKGEIERWMKSIANISSMSWQNDIMASGIADNTAEKKDIVVNSENVEQEINAINQERDKIILSWNNEDYISVGIFLENNFNENYVKKLDVLSGKILSSRNHIINAINIINNNTELLREIKNMKQELLQVTDYYRNEINDNNAKKMIEIDDIVKSAYDNYNSIINGKNVSLKKTNEILGEEFRTLVNFSEDKKQNYEYGISILNDSKEWIIKKIEAMPELNSTPLNYNDSLCTSLKNAAAEIERINDESKNLGESNISSANETDSAQYSQDKWDFMISTFDNTKINRYISENCFDVNYEGVVPKLDSEKLDSMDLSGEIFAERNATAPEYSLDYSIALKNNYAKCCVFDECRDCDETEPAYPVLFIHGHSMNEQNTPKYSMQDFAKIQLKMQDDGYIDTGELDLSITRESRLAREWGRTGFPITTRTSYYYITTFGVGEYQIVAQKSEKIENYALRLREIIDLIKFRTGAKKVNIVAHSMGGLVTRGYLQLFGYNDVDNVILVNTPNHGIDDTVYRGCILLGSSNECNDMHEGSIFLNRLNANIIPNGAKIFAMGVDGCSMGTDLSGDSIVTTKSAYLEGAVNYRFSETCPADAIANNLHTDFLDPDLYPESYDTMMSILKENATKKNIVKK